VLGVLRKLGVLEVRSIQVLHDSTEPDALEVSMQGVWQMRIAKHVGLDVQAQVLVQWLMLDQAKEATSKKQLSNMSVTVAILTQ